MSFVQGAATKSSARRLHCSLVSRVASCAGRKELFVPLPDGPRESCAPTEPVVVATSSDRRTLKLLDGAGGFRQWESLEESQTFARTFSKALIEAIVRGEGAVAVWIDGQVVLHTRRS